MPSDIQQVGYQSPRKTHGPVETHAQTTLSRRDPLVQAASFSQAEPRCDFCEDGTQIMTPVAGNWILGSQPEQYPDEYLLDGGDRANPVHAESYFRKGLDTEDTVAEYFDHTGKKHLKVSNSVAIYAPRFASVRKVTSPSGDTSIARLAGIQDLKRDSGVATKVGPDLYARADRLRAIRTRSRASGVANQEFQRSAFNITRLGTGTKLQNLFQDFSYSRAGRLEQADEARLALGIDAAAAWSREQNPVILAKLDSLHQVEAKFRPAELKMSEDLRQEPGRLQIVKLADVSTAKPGDLVTFMVRYDNLGERELNDVRIIDNLTPRLEYIEESATSDRPGDIEVQDNEEGSLVLTFKLDEPLPGKTGGVITFQCRVR